MRKVVVYSLFVLCGLQACSDDKLNILPNEENGDNLSSTTSTLWKEFLDGQKTGESSMLGDYSYAGYWRGEKDIPDNLNYPIFNVCDFGAIPDDGLSDRDAFIATIQAAQQNGSGIIYFPKGRYHLRSENEPNESIIIEGSNIILRGDGYGEDGTELFMEYPNRATIENALWSAPELISFRYVRSVKRELAQVISNASRGSFQVQVSNSSGMEVGDWVALELQNNDPQVLQDEVFPYNFDSAWTEWTTSGVQVIEYHQIKRINGDYVVFEEPLLYSVNAQLGWKIYTHSFHKEVGVEDIAFVGNFTEPFNHHQNDIHDSGFKPLVLSRKVNSWVRRCRFTNVSEALSITLSANVTVYDCVVTGNAGHAAIRSQASSRVFLGKIIDRAGQYHSVGVSKTAIGTVLWRNELPINSCFEAHASQPRETLIDACQGGWMRGRAGGSVEAGPNHLQNLVIWNYKETDAPETNFSFWATDIRYWKFLPPIIVGFHGSGTTFNPEQVKFEESNGKPVEPISLYEAQIINRLGYLPNWLRK